MHTLLTTCTVIRNKIPHVPVSNMFFVKKKDCIIIPSVEAPGVEEIGDGTLPSETASPLRPSPANPRRRSSPASPAASFQAIAAVAVGVGGCFWKLGSMVGVG
jgi:hypothetical protein